MRLLGKHKTGTVKCLLKKDNSPFLFFSPWQGAESNVIIGVPVSMFAPERTFRNESQRLKIQNQAFAAIRDHVAVVV